MTSTIEQPNDKQAGGDRADLEEETNLIHLADPSRYVTLPVQHEKIWRKYQKSLDWFWTVHEVYLADKEDMNKFTDGQRKFIHQVLAFMFVAHHTTINKELFMKLMNQVDIKEASYYLGSQADAKKTHCVMYSMLLDDLLGDKKDELISDIAKMSEVRNTLKWYLENLNSDEQPLSHRLLAFATLQGIVLEVAFVMFGWIQKQYPSMSLPGLYNSNKRIWRDEKLNLSFSLMLFDYIEEELDHQEARNVVKEAVFHAKKLFTEAIPVSMIEMDCDLIGQYIEHSADKLLADIHVEKLYNKESPFDWVIEPDMETNQTKIPDMGTMTANFGEANFDVDADF